MKLEVGKYYRTRDGNRVKIVSKDDHERYPINTDIGCSYTEEGNYWWTGDPSNNDLIAPWADTPEVGTLKEIGAQVGDAVEWVFDSETAATYEVMSIRESMYGVYADLKGYGEGVFTDQKFRIVYRANQAHTSPVRTVTTRKVVNQAVIGHVEVTKNGKIWMRHVDTADELTAAIATLTEIRDALAE